MDQIKQLLYTILISESSLKQLINYKENLITKQEKPGFYLCKQIDFLKNQATDLKHMSNEQFISLLLATKQPKIYTGRVIKCDGTDWNRIEFQILGNINIAMSVRVYDNGVWPATDEKLKEHTLPLEAELLFTPGALLRKNKKLVGDTPDYEEIVTENEIDQNKYNQLVSRRLSPLFTYIHESAKKSNTPAVVTIPGIGCGVFAGKFKGRMGEKLNTALQYIIEKNSANYSSIACVYYDPYNECESLSKEINGIKYKVRPFCSFGKSQLCAPTDYQEDNEDFSNCKLYKIVAWDHFSFPGNDFFVGSRGTDDGMAGAATDSMTVITGEKGTYVKGYYLPPEGKKNWKQVVEEKNIKLLANKNVKIVTEDNSYLTLNEYEQKAPCKN